MIVVRKISIFLGLREQGSYGSMVRLLASSNSELRAKFFNGNDLVKGNTSGWPS